MANRSACDRKSANSAEIFCLIILFETKGAPDGPGPNF